MTVVDTFRIDLPPSWQTLPTDAGELRKLLVEQHESTQWKALPRVEQRRTELLIERLIADLHSSRTVFASMFSEIVGTSDTPDTESPGAGTENASTDDAASEDAVAGPESATETLLASCTMSVIERSALGSDVPLTADVVLAAMSLERNDSESTEQATNLEPPTIVDLSAGRAVRMVRLVEQQLSLKEKVSFFTETYFVPVPEEWETLLVTQFATPNIGDAPVFSELFAAVANTIRFYLEGEPTAL